MDPIGARPLESASYDASTEVADQVRLRCPRCPKEARRKEMTDHLWAAHGLILEGKRVREPWRIIEDLVDEHRLSGDSDLVLQAQELAQRVDPANGVRRLQRLLLANQVVDPEARQTLIADAEQKHASLCPHCYEFVPLPSDISVPALSSWRGRVSGLGYTVEVDDSGLFSHLVVASPSGVIFRGLESGHWLSAKGWSYLVGAVPVYAALMFAVTLPAHGLLPLCPVGILLVLGFILCRFVGRGSSAPAARRSLDHAWRDLVPMLLLDPAQTDGIRYITGLIELCEQRQHYDVPRDLLRAVQMRVEEMLDAGQPAAALLGTIQRFVAARMARARQDPIPFLVEQAARTFRGELPYGYVQRLLADPAGTRSRLEALRLRLLLCRAAFDAGFEIRDILEACQAAPGLDVVFQTGDLRYLAMLRLVFSMQSQAPWEKLGGARIAYELAADPSQSEAILPFVDPLLLHLDRAVSIVDRGTAGPARIALCAAGVMLGGVLITAPPEKVEIRALAEMGLHELALDEYVFQSQGDPTELTSRLERWVRFFVQEFRPQSSEVLRWQSPASGKAIGPQQLVECPECHRRVFPRRGDVALPLEVGRPL